MAAPILFRHPLDSPLLLSELSCGAAVSGERTDIENGQQVQPVQLRRDVLPFLLRVRVQMPCRRRTFLATCRLGR
jgi:hypothetical protein